MKEKLPEHENLFVEQFLRGEIGVDGNAGQNGCADDYCKEGVSCAGSCHSEGEKCEKSCHSEDGGCGGSCHEGCHDGQRINDNRPDLFRRFNLEFDESGERFSAGYRWCCAKCGSPASDTEFWISGRLGKFVTTVVTCNFGCSRGHFHLNERFLMALLL